MSAIDPSSVRAVLFDAVGTLLLLREPVAATYGRLARPLGSKLGEPEIAERFAAALAPDVNGHQTSEADERQRWRQVVSRSLPDLPPDTADRLFEQLWRHYASPDAWRLCPHAADLWRQLATAGLTLGIASNFDGRLHEVRRGHPPLDSAEHCFVSSEIGWRKPSPRFFEAVAARLKLAPREILLVGDDPRLDYEPALIAGWQAVLLDHENDAGLDQLVPLLDGRRQDR